MALLLVRHASAGKRSDWKRDDWLRPLDERGQHQAQALVAVLARWKVDRVLTSPYVRCRQTVEPLAEARGLAIEERTELQEGAGREAAMALVKEIDGLPAVLCTHGDIVVDLLGEELKKGATAVLEVDGGLTLLETVRAPS
jgi:phosphohistidine phosphatase SixA